MERLAFDIVLLPSGSIKEQLVLANKQFCLKNHPISFSAGSRLPHISLLMGVIKKDDLGAVQAILKRIADKTRSLTLQISRQYNEPIPTGETVLGFEIKSTDALQSLHELVSRELSAYASYDAKPEDVFDANAEPLTLKWVNGFKENSSGKNFWPHITMGIGSNEFDFPAEEFVISELAMFHIGTYCTCPRDGLLGKWALNQ